MPSSPGSTCTVLLAVLHRVIAPAADHGSGLLLNLVDFINVFLAPGGAKLETVLYMPSKEC